MNSNHSKGLIPSFFHLPMLSFQQSTGFLFFNCIIFLFCLFIFYFKASCKETHNFNDPSVCFLRFDYIFLSFAYNFIHFCQKLLMFNYIIFLFFQSLMMHIHFMFHNKLQGNSEFNGLCKVWLLLSFICLHFRSFLSKIYIVLFFFFFSYHKNKAYLMALFYAMQNEFQLFQRLNYKFFFCFPIIDVACLFSASWKDARKIRILMVLD